MKKTFLFFLLLSSIIISCYRPKITSETFEITDDSLHIACKDLTGLGNLKIGITSIKDIKKDKAISLPKLDLVSSFSDDTWGCFIY